MTNAWIAKRWRCSWLRYPQCQASRAENDTYPQYRPACNSLYQASMRRCLRCTQILVQASSRSLYHLLYLCPVWDTHLGTSKSSWKTGLFALQKPCIPVTPLHDQAQRCRCWRKETVLPPPTNEKPLLCGTLTYSR